MSTDDHARLELLRRLEAVLGSNQAATLMTHLPPQPSADLAAVRLGT